MKLFERCIHTIDRIARIPDENAEQITRMGLEEFGKAATGKSLTEMLERIQIPKSNEHIFPEYFMDYMAATMEYLKHSMRPENGVDYDWEMALVNSYKSEFYRHAAFNFVSNNKMIIRLTDECAEYIDDVRLTAVNISDIDFSKNKFTLLFRMNERTFVILVQRDEYGIRVTGVNTTIDIEHEPAFASHIILFDTQKRILTR